LKERFDNAVTLGKSWEAHAKELKPALREAQAKAKDGGLAIAENKGLRDALSAEKDQTKHWRATAEAHMPKQQPVMHVPGKKPRLTQGVGAENGM
jgi:hypothetical protein